MATLNGLESADGIQLNPISEYLLFLDCFAGRGDIMMRHGPQSGGQKISPKLNVIK